MNLWSCSPQSVTGTEVTEQDVSAESAGSPGLWPLSLSPQGEEVVVTPGLAVAAVTPNHGCHLHTPAAVTVPRASHTAPVKGCPVPKGRIKP